MILLRQAAHPRMPTFVGFAETTLVHNIADAGQIKFLDNLEHAVAGAVLPRAVCRVACDTLT